MSRRIFNFEIDGEPALGFDTGLDPRAFAQAKLALFLNEPGLIVPPGGAPVETWKASGVIERAGEDGGRGPAMVIQGPPFEGERLDILINDSARQNEALAAVGRWIEARTSLGERQVSCRPCTALVSSGDSFPPGTVFFAPENLALRCVQAEGPDTLIQGGEWYVHPDLSGTAAAAFSAAAMLYRVFAGTAPFAAREDLTLRQDMRELNFLPVRLAAPGLDEKPAGLIQKALSGGAKTEGGPQSGAALLSQFLEILKPAAAPDAASFFHPLSEVERLRLTKEKEQFLKKKNLAVKTRRFVIRNTAIIAGAVAAVLIALLTARSLIKSRAEGPGTSGMDSAQVVQSYYDAFGGLDHQLMEVCVTKGAGKSDIEMVVNLFVISKVRQAYEAGAAPPIISAAQWRETGAGPVDSQVFGVTDLEIEPLSGNETTDEVRYRAAYTLWLPFSQQEEEESADAAGGDPAAETSLLPRGVHYTDELTLVRKRGNWRIAEINRVYNNSSYAEE
ncbi:MAG: hypothetical protein LBD47_06880 [Treponema sp.]|jgi:hypothetical protein|nr:hypothetical protein [Treponema sp.]